MGKLAYSIALVCLGAAFSLPALAKGADQDKAIATLEVNKGVIMISTGGEFLTGTSGQKLYDDERIMVTQDASATVVYNDHCKRTYEVPGVYKVEEGCKAVAWWFSGARTTTAVVAGVISVGVLVDNLEDADDHRPISR